MEAAPAVAGIQSSRRALYAVRGGAAIESNLVLRAAESAIASFDHDLAIELASYLPADLMEREVLLGKAHLGLGDIERGDSHLQNAAGLARSEDELTMLSLVQLEETAHRGGSLYPIRDQLAQLLQNDLGVAWLAEHDRVGTEVFGRAIDASLKGYAGDAPGVEKAMAGYFEVLAGEHTKADSIMFIGQTLLAAKRDGLGAGVDQAVAAGDEAIDNRDAQQWASMLFYQAVRFGEPAVVVKSLRRIADRIGGGVAPLAASHAEALLGRDEEALRRVSRGYLDLGYRPYAAEVLNAAAARSRRTRPARCSPAVVSRRTVDNHLHRIYRKFGIGGRDDLSDLMKSENL